MLKPAFLIEHPIWSGLVWSALFIPGVVLLEVVIRGDLPDSMTALAIRALLAGLAWGYAMRWWHKRRLDAAG